MMTLTITPAVIQLQLQWYAWVKFLQLLELALCHISTHCITRQHSCPALLIFKAIKLLPSYYLTPHPHLCLQSHQIAPNNSRTNFVPFTTITSYYEIPKPIEYRIFVAEILKYDVNALYTNMNNYIQELCYPVTVLISCVSHHHVLLRHSWAIQSGAMLSPLMGREWEDASGDQLGTTRTMESHKNLHSQDVSLVFPLPWSEKHKNYIYSSNNHGVVLKDCQWPTWFVNQPTASQS